MPDRFFVFLFRPRQLAVGHDDQGVGFADLLVPVERLAGQLGLAGVDEAEHLGVHAGRVARVPAQGLVEGFVHAIDLAQLHVALREHQQRIGVVRATLETATQQVDRFLRVPCRDMQLGQTPHDVGVVLVETQGLLKQPASNPELLGFHRTGALLEELGCLVGIFGHWTRFDGGC